MSKQTFFFLLAMMLLWISAPAWAKDPVMLQGVERRQDLASTTLTFRFSELPEYEVQSGGQRVDLYLLGDVVADDVGPLPEDERIIKVLLAGHRKGLLVSLLFRSPPARVSLEKNAEKKELSIDCLWSEPHGARPGLAMYIKGMPVPQKDGTAVISGLTSRFSADWNSLYAYWSPLQVQIPVSVFVPRRMPLPDGPWYSGLRDALGAARTGQWEVVGAALEEGRSVQDSSAGFLTLSASELIQDGKYALAVREAERLAAKGKKNMLGEYGTYVNALALAGSGAYPEAELVLRSRPDITLRNGGMAPYWRLLLAELAIQKGDFGLAGKYLSRDLQGWPVSLRQAVLVRRGDLLAESGKEDAALSAYDEAGDLERFPSAMWRKAELLFRAKEYARSATLYDRVKERVRDIGRRGLVQWRESQALVSDGRVEDGVFQLKMIVQDYYETEAFDRARLTLLDLGRLGKIDPMQGLAGVSYARVAELSKVRALRQEAMLKQALALHQDGNDQESIRVLERFLHEFITGPLRPDGQALLADILPGVVEGLIDAGESLQALVLVERNRDLLINSRIAPRFLKKLADGFVGLTLYTRAARVLQYLIDAGAPPSRESVYVPLAETFVRLGEADRLERLVREYESGFPRGDDRAVLRGMWAETLLGQGDVVGAVRALPARMAYGSPDLERLLARIHWEADNMTVVASCLKNIDLAENVHVYSSELLLRGEALVNLKRYQEALPVFKALSGVPEVAVRARYRLAGVLAALGREKQGRTLFEELAQDTGAGQWAVLAGEALKDLDLGALNNR